MIERGHGDRVKPHLASLEEQLRPLLDMLDKAENPRGRDDSSARPTWWHPH